MLYRAPVLFFTTKAKCHVVHEALRALWIERGMRVVPRWEDCSHYAQNSTISLVSRLEVLQQQVRRPLTGSDAYEADCADPTNWQFRESWQLNLRPTPPSWSSLDSQWRAQYQLIAAIMEAI